MRNRITLTAALTLLLMCTAQADVLWDNYPDSGYSLDSEMALSSERDTLIDATWTVDDAVFTDPVEIESVQWVGMHEPGYEYPFADLIILSADPDGGPEDEFLMLEDLEYTIVWQSSDQGLERYEATVELSESVALPAGHWYFGTRLVGDEHVGLGRNFVAAASELNPAGETAGYFWGPIFGAFDWLPVQDLPFIEEPRDYALQVHGVPEPGSVMLIAVGAVLAFYRRG
jgi:hypothetical protein